MVVLYARLLHLPYDCTTLGPMLQVRESLYAQFGVFECGSGLATAAPPLPSKPAFSELSLKLSPHSTRFHTARSQPELNGSAQATASSKSTLLQSRPDKPISAASLPPAKGSTIGLNSHTASHKAHRSPPQLPPRLELRALGSLSTPQRPPCQATQQFNLASTAIAPVPPLTVMRQLPPSFVSKVQESCLTTNQENCILSVSGTDNYGFRSDSAWALRKHHFHSSSRTGGSASGSSTDSSQRELLSKTFCSSHIGAAPQASMPSNRNHTTITMAQMHHPVELETSLA